MSSQTKMIIITSDEDIIRQFSFNKTKNTQIIDLDNGNQVISTAKDNNNTTNLNLLAQLSGIVCILFKIEYININIIFIFRIRIMIKYINVHLIHLIIINQNQLKYQKKPVMRFALFVVIMLLDLIMMFFRVYHVELFFVEMPIKIWLVFFFSF